ncbi:MFS transporter [Xanthobacter sediminis]
MTARTASYRPLSVLVGLAYFMDQLDSTIIAPALPQIALAFGVSPLNLDLTMTVYLLANVAVIPLSGLLAARFGTRTVFKCSLVLFALSSALCGFADTLPALIAARVLQGASAALMMPVGRMAIIHATSKADLVAALAWMITPAMLGPLVGPLLGGIIATYSSWRWIFFLNLPLGIAGYFAATRLMPQVSDEEPPAFDLNQWIWLALLLGTGATLLSLVRHPGIGLEVYAGLGAMLALAGTAYVRRVRGAARPPLLDFTLLKVSTFNVSFWGGCLVRVGYGALPFLLPLQLQLGLGFSAIQSGLVLLASGLVAFVTKTFTARILAHFGFRSVIIWNGVLCGLALALCAAFQASWSVSVIALLASIGGFFRAIQLNALAAIAYADLPRRSVAPATSLNTTFQQFAVMIGISLSVTVVNLSAWAAQRPHPAGGDYGVAFLVLAAIVLAAVPLSFRLQPGAGHELSGHRRPSRSPTGPA